jgi:hypothetical protein
MYAKLLHREKDTVNGQRAFTVLNTIVLGLFARQGETNVAHARRDFAYHLDKALVRLVA